MCCFYFVVDTFGPYGPLYSWFVVGEELTPTPTEIVPYKIPTGIIDYVLANRYAADRHPGEHLLCSLFKLAGVPTEFFMRKQFSVSLKDKASDWYKLLDNSDLLD